MTGMPARLHGDAPRLAADRGAEFFWGYACLPWTTVRAWAIRTRQRRALGALDRHLLRDIGLTPEEAMREAGKAFWRD
jgi:uncharacterized protein YjiS (DUF1127 family)